MYDQSSVINRRINIVIVVLVIIDVLLFGYFIYRKLTLTNAYVSPAFAQNIQYPYQVNNHEIYFFTGSSLASYDTNTYTTKKLSEAILPNNLGNLQWTRDGAFFTTYGPSYNDDAGLVLAADGITSNGSYVWYLGFSATKPALIGSTISSYRVDHANNTLLFAAPSNNVGVNLEVYNPASGKTSLVSSYTAYEDMRVVYADDNTGYVLLGNGSSIELVSQSLTTNGRAVVLTNPFNNSAATIRNQLVMPNSHQVLFIKTTKESTNDLVLYNTASKHSTVLYHSFNGLITPGYQDVVATNMAQELISFIHITPAGTVSTANVLQPKNGATAAFMLPGGTLFINNLGQAFLVSANKHFSGLPSVPTVDLSKKVSSPDDFYLYRDPSNALGNAYSVTVVSGSYHQQVRNFLNLVRKAGYDPTQFNFSFMAAPIIDPTS